MFKFDDMMTVAKFMIAQNDFSNNENNDNLQLDLPDGQMRQGGMTSSQGRGGTNSIGVGGGGGGIVSAACFTNCSGHGLCHEGECWCEVQFRGTSCQTTNLLYYTIFSCLFFLLSLISLIQLAVCVQAEYHKRHKPTIRDVFRLTNQKLVYFFVTIATASRGFYFAIQLTHPVISFNLQTVYYPLILTIFSLIVCKWAEWFHINDMPPTSAPGLGSQTPTTPLSRSPSTNRFFTTQITSTSSSCAATTSQFNQKVHRDEITPASSSGYHVHTNRVAGSHYQHHHLGGGHHGMSPNSSFLTKSLGAFITFNVLMYILLFLQLLATNTWVKDIAGKKYWMRISKACFASLTLLVVVFFLIYGVEMFFKVRGAFVDANRRLNRFVACSSRLSLIAQAGCLLFLALFLFSDVAFIHFEKKITDLGISYFDTACRAVDLCVAIWFPLVLWKSAKPDELWLLNPRVLFQKGPGGYGSDAIVAVYTSSVAPRESFTDSLDSDGNESGIRGGGMGDSGYTEDTPTAAFSVNSPPQTVFVESTQQECFICYDSERDDAGPLIKPCKCKGDTSVVHHDCLRRWILESLGGIQHDSETTERITNNSTSSSPRQQSIRSSLRTNSNNNGQYTSLYQPTAYHQIPSIETSDDSRVESVSFGPSRYFSSNYPAYSGIASCDQPQTMISVNNLDSHCYNEQLDVNSGRVGGSGSSESGPCQHSSCNGGVNNGVGSRIRLDNSVTSSGSQRNLSHLTTRLEAPSSFRTTTTTTAVSTSSGPLGALSSSFRLSSGGLGLLLGGADARNQLKCKVCNQPYQLQTSFMIQCQAQNWKVWLRWVLGLSAMTALPFAASAVFQITTEPAPRVLSLAVLFLFEYALWRLAGFNLVTLYNYAKFSSFRIEGKEVRSSTTTTTSAIPRISPNQQPPVDNGSSEAVRNDIPTPGQIDLPSGLSIPVVLDSNDANNEKQNLVVGIAQQERSSESVPGIVQSVPAKLDDEIRNNMQQCFPQETEPTSTRNENSSKIHTASRTDLRCESASIENEFVQQEIRNDGNMEEKSGQPLEISGCCSSEVPNADAIQRSNTISVATDHVVLGDSTNSLEVYASDIIAEVCSHIAHESIDGCSQV